jgi:pantetheine-phosphate adenylyltransferase
LYPDITTVLLFTPAEYADISSSTVRELLAFGREVDWLLPEGVDLKEYM